MKVARAGYAAGRPKLEDLVMLQTVASLKPSAVDYERTLVLAIESSNKSWVLAAQVPGLPYTRAKCTVNKPRTRGIAGGHCGISLPRRRYGLRHRARDRCLRGRRVGLLAGAAA